MQRPDPAGLAALLIFGGVAMVNSGSKKETLKEVPERSE